MKKICIALLFVLITCSLFAQQKKAPPPKPIKLLDLFKKKNNQQPAQTATQACAPQNSNMGFITAGDMPITEGNLTSGEYCTIILKYGVLYGWGDNSYGQSGVGKSGSNFTPV